MKSGRPLRSGPWIRRAVQLVFLLAFFTLVVLARPRPGVDPSPLWKSFFLIDPLILAATWLAAHAVVPGALLLSLLVVAVTVLLGRVFCGWACPLGTIHAVAGHLFHPRKRKPKGADHWSRWQRAKYYLLIAFLTMAVFGGHWVTIFDPLVLLYRTTTVALLPAVQWAVEEGSTAVYQADPGVGAVRLTQVTEPVYEFMRDHVFVVPDQAFLGAGLIVGLFALTLALNAYRRRFWCRYLCPLGALLGLFAWRPLLRRRTQPETCNQCDLCGTACHGAATEAPGGGWKPAECLGCLNCTSSCPRGSLGFRLAAPWRKRPAGEKLGMSRRAAFGAAAGGVAVLALFRANPQSRGRQYHPRLIRPPGALGEREFLERCTACGLCMKVCPTGALQPAITEAGLEGLWTPRLVPKLGYCDYTCNLCGQVCPTGAIQALTVEAKQQTKIGLASFDTSRCIPYAYGRECIVCEEHCPVPDKAIYVVEVEVEDHDGNRRIVKQPRVDPDRCTGCGICENKCVFTDRPAIRVASANESRNPGNQPILPGDDMPY
jgi:MauM/NapG family ferredoxin protein